MSKIFDALQKSETERSGTDLEDLTATELLQVAERGAAAEPEFTVQANDFPVGTRTEASRLEQPEIVLQPLQQGGQTESGKPQAPKLEMEEIQRDEVMKFVQHVFLMRGVEAPRTALLTASEPGNG